MLWLAWALFGAFLVWLLGKRYLPEVRNILPLPKPVEGPRTAWLLCEEGPPLDAKVRWFALRTGGRTVIGRKPRTATSECLYVYLTAEDILEDHVQVTFNPTSGRYELEALPRAVVRHNNGPLDPGARSQLSDGDLLEFGKLSLFKFTHAGPENP